MKAYFLVLWVILLFLLHSCKPVEYVQTGEEAYEYKQYAKAIPLLENEFDLTDEETEKAKIAFLLGESNYKINQIKPALKWYDEAVKHGAKGKSLSRMAKTFASLGMYDRAIKTLQYWESNGGPTQQINREIRVYKAAQSNDREEQGFQVNKARFNSAAADFSPTMYKDGRIVFSSDRGKPGSDDQTYFWTGRSFMDFYISDPDGRNVDKFNEIPINSPHNEGSITFNKDFTEVFFTRCSEESDKEYCRIYYLVQEDETWSQPREPFYMDPNHNYVHPVLVENDSVLIFSSNHPGGLGGYDLYYSVREEEGWSEFDLMPKTINTIGNEFFPTADGDTLYFSSDYIAGLGGTDIFKTFLNEERKWTPVEHLKKPFNSSYDDFGFIITSRSPKVTGYFSSSRDQENNDDLFYFESITNYVPTDTVVAEIDPEPEEAKEYDVYMAIVATDKSTGSPISAVNVNVLENATPVITTQTDAKGRVIETVHWETTYEIIASSEGYFSSSANLTTGEMSIVGEDKTYNIRLNLEPIEYDKEITLENIFYDYDKYDIRNDAKPALQTLVQLLKNNPEIRIELGSHTDCRGTTSYNETLSENRARAAVQYIIESGIEANRLQSKGYGENAPQVQCLCELCTEAQHQSNRRTTFKVIH